MGEASVNEKRLELLSETEDPNEFIETFRLITADENALGGSELFPLTDDAAGDLVCIFLGVWLATRADLPVENREQVVRALDDMAALIERMKERIPSEPHALKRGVLHCLRRGARPYLDVRRP